MIALGTNEMAKAYVGSSEVSKVYLGNDLVWERDVSPEYRDMYFLCNKTGTGYIDTGFYPNNDTNIICSMVPYNSSYDFGARTAAFVDAFGFYAYGYTGANIKSRPRYDYGTKQLHWGADGNVLKMNTVYDCHNNGNVMSIDIEGSTYSINIEDNTFQCDYSMYLFGVNNGGTPSVTDCAKFLGFKVYDNGNLVRDYVPKQRIVDNIFGLYDNVNHTFNVSPNGALFTGGTIDELILNYQGITENSSGIVKMTSANSFIEKRATLLQLRTADNAIKWANETPSVISNNYTLMHKVSNNLTIAVNKSNYYCSINVYVRNGNTYTCPYSTGWTRPTLTADLSSYTGDEVWLNVNFKFNSAGSATAILLDSDYTITWS